MKHNIIIDTPDYPKNFTKHNARQRKKMGILQHGNGLLGFKFNRDDTLDEIITDWWDQEYEEHGEDFNVEVYFDTYETHIMFFTDLPFYKLTNKAKIKHKSLQDNPSSYCNEYIKALPEAIQELVVDVIISDWDYIKLEGGA